MKLGRLDENKLLEVPRKQKRLSKHVKRQQWQLLRLPLRQYLSKKMVKPLKVSGARIGERH